jgi:hypothetical protein
MKVISYNELVLNEGGTHIQKGMNFGIKPGYSIVLMSTEKNAPYNDNLLEDGVIEYEGHDAPKSQKYDKKKVDQPIANESGTLTENGKFLQAAQNYKEGSREPAAIKVYRKIRKGVWVDMGLYDLVDTFEKFDGARKVQKFLLRPNFDSDPSEQGNIDLVHNRDIPGDVMREVFARDKGRCQQCGSSDNLHFDHIIPFSKGGSSKVVANIQLLCARHNLSKGSRLG